MVPYLCMRLRVFVGIARTEMTSAFSLTVFKDKESIQIPAQIVKGNQSNHLLVLSALKYAIEIIADAKENEEIEVMFYGNNDDVMFEWHTEFAEDKGFSPQTNDKMIWGEIVKLVSKNKIKLTIIGTDNVLQNFNKVENKRLKRWISRNL